jgi:hypothetical protein
MSVSAKLDEIIRVARMETDPGDEMTDPDARLGVIEYLATEARQELPPEGDGELGDEELSEFTASIVDHCYADAGFLRGVAECYALRQGCEGYREWFDVPFEVGDEAEVPDPGPDDPWAHSFVGRVKECRAGIATVVDQDDVAWDVDVSRLTPQ